MTVLESKTLIVSDLESEHNHFCCCELPLGFTGFTTALCGANIFEYNLQDWIEGTEVCEACLSAFENWTCPFKLDCSGGMICNT